AQFKMGSGDLVSSPLAAALDPRVDEDTVMTQMHDEDFIAARRQVPAGYDEDIEQEVADDSFDALVISESESANQSNN
ncbi:MFS transporter, partial [Rheinheimera baltica]|nr:MFS transporter [Rheinheimera baltica]